MSHGDTAPPYARFESISRSVRTTAHTHLSIWVEPGQDAAVAHLASHERVDPQPKATDMTRSRRSIRGMKGSRPLRVECALGLPPTTQLATLRRGPPLPCGLQDRSP